MREVIRCLRAAIALEEFKIDSLGERGKDAKSADFVDATFVRELDESGFTRDLYQQR